MPGLVIFDLDGVLIDTESTAAAVLVRVFARIGYEISKEQVIDRFIGTGVRGILDTIAGETARTFPASLPREIEMEVRREVFRNVVPVRGIRNVLDRLAAQPWCVASNSGLDRMETCMRLSGLAARYRVRLFSAAMVPAGKPAPDLYCHVARSFALPPSSCIVVEDTVVGVVAGKAAGMTVLGFAGASHITTATQRQRLAAAGADAIVTTTTDLAEQLEHFLRRLP